MIVIVAPDVEQVACVAQAREQVYVQEFVPEPADEALDEAVLLPRFPGCDVVPVDGVCQSARSRQVVRRILRGERDDVFRIRASSLEPWLGRLDAEWTAGCRNGAELWRRLRTAGFGGSLRVVTEWATRRRRAEAAPNGGPRKCPSARAIARMMMTTARDHLTREDAVTVAMIEAAVPRLAAARELIGHFQTMIRQRNGAALRSWLQDAAASLLASFANGLRADEQAVAAALAEPWSNGQTEGQITKLKLVKRQMYGRAKPDLLRARLLGAASRAARLHRD